MPVLFNVTYEIVAQDSVRYGYVSERGWIAQHVRLREAVESVFETRTSKLFGVQGVEANEWPVICPRWITVQNGMEYETGAQECRSLHIQDSVTPASRRRIAKLMGVRS
jgi:hypothetical protein